MVDVISWGVLLQDLTMLLNNPAHTLPAKTLSQQDWNQALFDYANAPELLASKENWLALGDIQGGFDHVSTMQNTPGHVGDANITRYVINASLTQQILHDANEAFTTEPQHLLLSALTLASDEWAGAGKHLVNLESHGREALDAPRAHALNHLEPGRTVGWFTSASPFLLDSASLTTDAVIKDVKERLRRIPAGGRDYGVLRWLSTQLSKAEQQALANAQAQIGFNYLGLLDGEQQVMPLDRALTTSAHMEQTLALDFVLFVSDGQLTIELMYDSQRISETQADSLLAQYQQALQHIADFCAGREQSEKTATDFTVTELDQDEFDDILDDIF